MLNPSLCFCPICALSDRLSHIIEELKALQSDVALGNASEEPLHERSSSTDCHNLRLRRIQRYVEWTVPELLPERAEDAETLVNVARFAARLLIQEKAGNASSITTQIQQSLDQSLVQNVA